MNPLSIFTYYRRHKRSALLLIVIISIVTLGIYTMVGLLDSLTENLDILSSQLTRFGLVYPATADSLDPTVSSQIRVHPDVAQVIPVRRLNINMPLGIATGSWSILGVPEADIPTMMRICDVRLKEGRLLEPHTNELMLPEEVARALKLEIGDQIDRSIDESIYGSISEPLLLVGILEGDHSPVLPSTAASTNETGPLDSSEPSIRVGFVSYEYLDSHEAYMTRPSGLIVIAREGAKETVDTFLETSILSSHTDVETAPRLFAMTDRVRRSFRLVCGVIDGLVAVVIALVVAFINQIALTRRLADLGLLHTLGHHKGRLVRHLTLETAIVTGIGWAVGLALSWLSLAWVRASFYEPSGMELSLMNLIPIWFTAPIPLVVIGSMAVSVTRVFNRLDSVAIIERGKLGTEARCSQRTTKRSSARPLSAGTFYRRHRRRGLMLVGAVALMVLGITFPMFLTSAMIDSQNPFFLNHLRYVSEVQARTERSVDPGTMAQIRTHPAVAHAIPAMPLGLTIEIPPLSISQAKIYGVSEHDLPVLINLFEMQLQEGRLPQPQSNEIVLSEALALNRNLGIGDTVGRPAHEQEEDIPEARDADMPTEMVVVGILASKDIALGFVSQEYLESHERYSDWGINLLIVPVEGHKAELDTWLEEHMASEEINVSTYGATLQEGQQSALAMHLVFAVLESMIAIIAAITLTALNHIFFAQRQEEFGILHAAGRNRLWLTLRAARESGSVVAVGWLAGAALCIVGLICAQVSIYGPKGLSLDLGNPAPWLFTLPIPLAVVLASVGTIGWMLSRLDPVSIIERR